MEYNGYLLKVNGTIVPNKFINTSSYEATPVVRRVIDSGYYGNGESFVVYSPHTTSEISFQTNGMLEAKMRAFLTYFPSNDTYEIEFYDFKTDTYYTKAFRANDFKFALYKIRSDGPIYKSMPITLKSI